MLRWLTLYLLALTFLVSCTAAVRYSHDPESERQRERAAESASTKDEQTGRFSQDYNPKEDEDSDEVDSRESDNRLRNPREQNTQIDREKMNRIVANYLGTPYARGGTGRMGIDCSGLMYVFYRDYDGTRLPLSTEALYRLDNRIDYNDLTYGDLVFFRLSGRKVSHVGMYLENGRFVHASESRGVIIDELTTEYYATSYAGARRIK